MTGGLSGELDQIRCRLLPDGFDVKLRTDVPMTPMAVSIDALDVVNEPESFTLVLRYQVTVDTYQFHRSHWRKPELKPYTNAHCENIDVDLSTKLVR